MYVAAIRIRIFVIFIIVIGSMIIVVARTLVRLTGLCVERQYVLNFSQRCGRMKLGSPASIVGDQFASHKLYL